MEIQQFEAGFLAYIRVVGPYGENYEAPCDKLYQWSDQAGVADKPWLFIFHDNPDVTPAKECRTDICILLDKEMDVGDDITLQSFAGGKYATHRVTMTEPSQASQAWAEAMENVAKQNLISDDRPCFELYHSYDQKTHVADISFCVAIK